MPLDNYKLREGKIEKAVKEYAKQQGWVIRKFKSPGQRSVPDDICMKDGFMFFIEFKAPGKEPTEAQKKEHCTIREHGGFYVYVIDHIGTGKKLFN